eukprot:CAMPEP_0183485440 /NCGR_PEP_ID=MMETSP0370-20130417/179432_1 /TAXON_ID=268820 /ORGANISM="Peridinium aciculiferum, Strain PAER-2" /LENGTH=163 /DNA_ID=CAMNT_0025678745 /DNA_START=56 /DNA_END=548 /DNA_ORIENTATION=+
MARSSSTLRVFAMLAAATVLLQASFGFVGVAPRGALRSSVALRATASAETMGKVADIIAEQLGVAKEKVTRVATLSELGADSLDIVESVMALEEGFDVELPDEETIAMKNVGGGDALGLGADSLDIVESVMALEEGFDVELPDEETIAMKNVGDVMDLIQSKL